MIIEAMTLSERVEHRRITDTRTSQLAMLYNAIWHGAELMTATEYVVDVLGGSGVFKGKGVPTVADVRERIKGGLPYRSLESVRERLRLSVPETASILDMPAR